MSNKIVDKITATLLSNNMTAYDLVEPNEGVTFEDAYTEKYMKEHISPKGEVTPPKSLPECLNGYSKEQVLEYAKGIDKFAYTTKHMVLPLRLNLDDIDRTLKGYGTWKELEYDEKLQLLHHLGMDVLVGTSNNTTDFSTRRGIHRNASGKLVEGVYVIGNERTDAEWLSSPKASIEAKLYTEDYTLAQELEGMNR